METKLIIQINILTYGRGLGPWTINPQGEISVYESHTEAERQTKFLI